MSKRLKINRDEDAGELWMNLWFSDGIVPTVDVGTFIRENPHPQYNEYLKPERFKTFQIENGNVVWGESWDLIFPVAVLHRVVADEGPVD